LLVMIPVIAFIVPIVFSGLRFNRPPFYTPRIYLTTLVSTTIIWIGNRFILIQARKKYPQFSLVRKRIIVQSLLMLAFTLAATNALGYFLNDFCEQVDASGNVVRTTADVIINSNNAAIFCSMTVVAIYETFYFIDAWRTSIEEKEMFKRESLNAQISALKTQVNPHFLFNNLNVLSALVMKDNAEANEFIEEFSKVYRYILKNHDKEMVPLKTELDYIKPYIFLLQKRFGEGLKVSMEIPVSYFEHFIIPVSLQMLIENAIKHNIVSKTKPLQINIYANGNNTIVVSNNLQVKQLVERSTELGLQNIVKRYRLVSNRVVLIDKNEHKFSVTIPLLPVYTTDNY
jgi:two-component system LytT family sensor kinase